MRRVYSSRGILYAVAYDRDISKRSTIEVIATAIVEAHAAGYTTPDAIARFLVTSSFQFEPDKRVRFNSAFQAGNAVGAEISAKLVNGYRDLLSVAQGADESLLDHRTGEARGFAKAAAIVHSPFMCEAADDPRKVDWVQVCHQATLFEAQHGSHEVH